MTITKRFVTNGCHFVEIPEAELRILCGCPADSVKHLMKRGINVDTEQGGVFHESGPNAILVSDSLLQNGMAASLAEFPVLQMLYRQGMILPGHPNNTGVKPLIMGLEDRVTAQMQYIHRGNYGLISEAEIIESGIGPERARELMCMKLKFGFGKIRETEELIDSLVIGDDWVEIRNGARVRRAGFNEYEFSHHAAIASVNLNLAPGEQFIPPYALSPRHIPREYFAIVHTGQGDGWDVNRPSMSSIVIFQGKIYLIDAAANILHSLRALGIGINEIEGIFHTHAHDDHFAGLTDIVRADHKIRYFATPLVRASVVKKLSALLAISENRFGKFFEVHDLEFDVWNDIEGLEVFPVLSPHPVETNILVFRALFEKGYRSYAHFADIAAFRVLEDMVVDDPTQPGMSREFVDRVKRTYLKPADIKKLDIGGGLIHGDATDFRGDKSDKIVLAHKAEEATDEEKEIGVVLPFGAVDVLIQNYQNYERRNAYRYLESYFPNVSYGRLTIVLNSPIETFDPGSVLEKKGEPPDDLFLSLTGDVERDSSSGDLRTVLSSGVLVGESYILKGSVPTETYRTRTYVQALKISGIVYLEFVMRNDLFEEITRLESNRLFLRSTYLFGDELSRKSENEVCQRIRLVKFERDRGFVDDDPDNLSIGLIREGRIERNVSGDCEPESLFPRDFFGEETALFGVATGESFRALEPSSVYLIPVSAIRNIPVVRWKLLEAYQRRVLKLKSRTDVPAASNA